MPDLDPAHESPQRVATPTAAIFDLDGTITQHSTYIPFIWRVARTNPAKLIHVAPILAAAALYRARLMSRAKLKELMLGGVLGGMPMVEVQRYAVEFTDQCMRQALRPGALKRIERHKAAGDYLILATASFEFYAEIFGQRLGFDQVIATKTVRDPQGRITGAIDGENCRGEAKLRRIFEALPALKAQFRVVAYSDHHVDLPLLRWADCAFAVNPTKSLRQQAPAENFEILDWNVA